MNELSLSDASRAFFDQLLPEAKAEAGKNLARLRELQASYPIGQLAAEATTPDHEIGDLLSRLPCDLARFEKHFACVGTYMHILCVNGKARAAHRPPCMQKGPPFVVRTSGFSGVTITSHLNHVA